MLGIDYSQSTDNQPIQASILKERRLLTSWITPDSLEVQNKYDQLTSGLSSVSYTHLPSPRDRTRSRMPSSA